ncbi:MAG: phospho-sugar mutase [Clostridiales bacterium]|nr:phospho-sugar mutase [Clostridiales bacterium]
MEEYKYWLESDVVDETTKEELRMIADNEEEIKGRFSKTLSFGTAGLRGVMKAGTNAMNLYVVRHATQGFANLIIEEGGQLGGSSSKGHGVVIAHDSRNNSNYFAQEAASVLAANGIGVYIFDELRPTPELSFAVREFEAIAGINITASHNPKEYNGYKAYWADGAQLSPNNADRVVTEINKADIFEDVKLMPFADAVKEGKIVILGSETDEKYISQVMKQSIGDRYIKEVGKDLKIVYTPFHGAGYKFVPDILGRLGYEKIINVQEQMIPDGEFTTLKSPNPENIEGFELAIEYAKREDADLIIGTDPDSDRCGVVVRDEKGNYIALSGNQIACLMIDYIITVRNENGTMPNNPCVCRSIVSTVMADKICDYNSIKMFKVLTGFKFIGEKMNEIEESGEYNLIFAFEESIGFLAGTYARDKDAVLASMLISEIGCYYRSKGMSLYEGLQSLYRKYGYYIEDTQSKVFEGYDAQEKMSKIMAEIRSNPIKVIGLKVEELTDYMDNIPGFTKSNVLFYTLSDGCAVAVRPSGTEPKIKTYVMASGDTSEEAIKRKDLIRLAIDGILGKQYT